MSFSVLLSLYAKEKPEFLKESLESVFHQTLSPDEVVLVLDGPITFELQEVVDYFSTKYASLKVVPLKENQGLGKALNEGLKYCKYPLVVRMDTDDICMPDRFEKQVEFMSSHPEIDASSTWIAEFVDSTDNIVGIRKLPSENETLRKFAKKRNPLNHPSTIFRKSAVQNAGGYMHFPLFEDYYLWVRMISNGSKIANIPECLLYFRSSTAMMRRRGGWKYAKDEMRFQWEMKKLSFLTNTEMIKNISVRLGVRLMPNGLRKFVYEKLLRR